MAKLLNVLWYGPNVFLQRERWRAAIKTQKGGIKVTPGRGLIMLLRPRALPPPPKLPTPVQGPRRDGVMGLGREGRVGQRARAGTGF